MFGCWCRVRIYLFVQDMVEENLESMSEVFQVLVLLRQPQRFGRLVRIQVEAKDIGQEEVSLYCISFPSARTNE